MINEKIYRFGKNGEFYLSQSALGHIIHGDYAIRPFNDSAGQRHTEEVLSGGLHTWEAWKKFLTKHSGTVHLADFDPEIHQGWYFARELQNGVITLKIPRELFSSDAASITMMPDTHYKSGYLWKTLFPMNYTEIDIVGVIEEALLNIDTDESQMDVTQSLIIGFARTMDPFTAIRIRIQLIGNQIRSAFPTWDQPFTGNNGKPYSHEHSISFHIASSTLGIEGDGHKRSCLFPDGQNFSLEALINLTPKFVIERQSPVFGQIQNDWHEERRKIIRAESASFSAAEIYGIQAYLNDFCISKEPFILQFQIYEHYHDEIVKSSIVSNVASIIQNVSDCYFALMHTDNLNRTNNYIVSMQRFLAMAVIYAGGLNTLEFRRIIKLLLECSQEHHENDSLKIFMESLSISPCRSALYSEFNINPYVKENNEKGIIVVGTTGIELAFNKKHLIDYISINLGENYLIVFSKKERERIAEQLIAKNYSDELICGSVLYWKGDDFDFFSNTLQHLDKWFSKKTVSSETTLTTIIREYSRMLLLYRQRIVMEDPESYRAEFWDYEFGSEEFFECIQQKHKRLFIIMMHTLALEELIKFTQKHNYVKLGKRASHLLSVMLKERIPTPKLIPQYIPNWTQDEKYKNRNVKTDFSVI